MNHNPYTIAVERPAPTVTITCAEPQAVALLQHLNGLGRAATWRNRELPGSVAWLRDALEEALA